LTPERVREIQKYHKHKGDACPGSGCEKCEIAMLLRLAEVAEARLAELRAVVEAAPHDGHCLIYDWEGRPVNPMPCNCWKSRLPK
jgi:hypothetical protein